MIRWGIHWSKHQPRGQRLTPLLFAWSIGTSVTHSLIAPKSFKHTTPLCCPSILQPRFHLLLHEINSHLLPFYLNSCGRDMDVLPLSLSLSFVLDSPSLMTPYLYYYVDEFSEVDRLVVREEMWAWGYDCPLNEIGSIWEPPLAVWGAVVKAAFNRSQAPE